LLGFDLLSSVRWFIGLLYILFVTVILKSGLRFLIDSTISLMILLTIFTFTFIDFGYLIYKYSPKNKTSE